MIQIALRPATETDHEFLVGLYASVRAAELEMVPWTAAQKAGFVAMQFAAQTASYAERFPAATHEVISVDGEAVGRIYLSREPERLHILDITIAPDRRNQGIGSAVLAPLVEEADRTARRLSIYVEDFNPSLRLFERMGFRVEIRDGFQLLLVRLPAVSAATE